MIGLLEILQLVATSGEISIIAEDVIPVYSQKEFHRLNAVVDFISKNYTFEISLVDAAAVCNMSQGAFSRYFKERTRKSFSDYIIQLRIAYACKLLMSDSYTVLQACAECGFNSLSNFNKQFKQIMNQSPKKYQMQFRFEVFEDAAQRNITA